VKLKSPVGCPTGLFAFSTAQKEVGCLIEETRAGSQTKIGESQEKLNQ
jgi:hypothetical protein